MAQNRAVRAGMVASVNNFDQAGIDCALKLIAPCQTLNAQVIAMLEKVHFPLIQGK
jgi:hypothetical protein